MFQLPVASISIGDLRSSGETVNKVENRAIDIVCPRSTAREEARFESLGEGEDVGDFTLRHRHRLLLLLLSSEEMGGEREVFFFEI